MIMNRLRLIIIFVELLSSELNMNTNAKRIQILLYRICTIFLPSVSLSNRKQEENRALCVSSISSSSTQRTSLHNQTHSTVSSTHYSIKTFRSPATYKEYHASGLKETEQLHMYDWNNAVRYNYKSVYDIGLFDHFMQWSIWPPRTFLLFLAFVITLMFSLTLVY